MALKNEPGWILPCWVPPSDLTWVGQLNMGKKIKNAWNGLKIIMAKFYHVELPLVT